MGKVNSFLQKKNKYKAVGTYYNDRYYHSKKEALYAQQLDWRKKAGEIKDIEPQYKIELMVKGCKICNYIIDFKVTLKDGQIELHEVKGYETDVWKLKWKLTHALLDDILPGAKLVLIK